MSPALTDETTHYQVAIVGGGIAGITLALIFERLGIKYVLFEASESLAPDKGASIGLLPNGLRILDQLGLIEEIEKHTAALRRWRHFADDGNVLSMVNALGYYPSILGYGGLFLERQKLLQIMSDRIESKQAIRTGTRVTGVREKEDHVAVTVDNGPSVTADLVIGANGVRSCVRDAIELAQPNGRIQSDKFITTRFACVYGISLPTPGISEGDCFSLYRKEATILGFTGKGGVVFWFVFEDLGRAYVLSETPRYSAADVDAVCRSVGHLQVSPTVRFGDLYANRKVAVKVALEEGMAEIWQTDRMVIVGDAAHKMVPNAAMGANQAIESSALLANELHKVLRESPRGWSSLSRDSLKAALYRYSQCRQPRTRDVIQKAGMACRAQLCHGGPAAAILRELPSLTDGDWLLRGIMGLADAPVVHGIELSARGYFYDEAVEKVREKVQARQRGTLSVSNSGLFGLE